MAPILQPPQLTYTIRPATFQEVSHLAAIEDSAGQLFRTVGLDSVADDDPMPPEVLRSYLEEGNLWVAVVDGTVMEGVNGVGGEQQKDDAAKPREESRQEEKGEVVGFLAAFPILVTGTGAPDQREQRPEHDRGDAEKEQQRPQRCHKDTTQSEESSPSKQNTQLMHIAELSVHASHHRRGLGKRLLRYFEEAVTARATTTANPSTNPPRIIGLSLTTYATLPFNAPFYRSHGFCDVPPSQILRIVGQRGRELWEEEQGKIARPEWRCWMVKWLDRDKDRDE